MSLGLSIKFTDADGNTVFADKLSPADLGSDLDPQDHSAENRDAFQTFCDGLTYESEVVDRHKPED